jgi:hypothetical protein
MGTENGEQALKRILRRLAALALASRALAARRVDVLERTRST